MEEKARTLHGCDLRKDKDRIKRIAAHFSCFFEWEIILELLSCSE